MTAFTLDAPTRLSKSICIPFDSESHYEDCMQDRALCRSHLSQVYAQHPELFPSEMGSGFIFHGFTHSQKQQLCLRRIRLKATGQVYQIRPSFVMPYMVGRTDEVEKALYLRHWGVPFDALAYVFGRDGMYWYRLYTSLGRNSIVGTTLKAGSQIPVNLLADEKHTRLGGERVYVATTVSEGVFLGAALSESASTDALTQAYQEFQQEAFCLDPDYTPKTVNTDGWEPTQKAWKMLFPAITIILCFLHAFLKIKERCKRDKPLLKTIGDKVWNAYHAETRAQFSQRIRRLREWTQTHLQPGSLKDQVNKLCQKAPLFRKTFQCPNAYRTSATLDRLMDYQDRILYAARYCHGSTTSARLFVRAMALLFNFHPYGSRTTSTYPDRTSPFHDVNGCTYHENWLHNLMLAASMAGTKT